MTERGEWPGRPEVEYVPSAHLAALKELEAAVRARDELERACRAERLEARWLMLTEQLDGARERIRTALARLDEVRRG